MILKAGTYRFNDELSLYSTTSTAVLFEFISNGQTYDEMYLYSSGGLGYCYNDGNDEDTAYNSKTSSWDEVLQIITIPTDTEVDDTFGTWYIANTNYNEVNAKPLAEITYNGETIAQLNAGETATLSCEGKKMVSDVVVKVNEVESGGDCDLEHIIEVDELPTENINQKTFYALKQPFSDIVVYESGSVISFVEYMTAEGATVEIYTIPTKTTDNIQISNSNDGLFYLYYIEDSNDIFLYGDAEGSGTNDWMSFSLLFGGCSFGGCISTKEEATLAGVYYALGGAVEYYQYADHGFVDVLEVEDDGAILSYIELYAELGTTVPLTSLSTKPTEATDGYYYIEDEDALYLYNSNGWNAETPFNGVITDKAQAIEVGYYALFRRGFEQYVVARGSLKIEHNGTHPVADKAEVIVNVPTNFIVQTVAELSTDCTNGSMAIVLGGE